MDATLSPTILADNIRRLMAERGINEKALARSAGLGPTGVRDILQGKSGSPRVETLAKIARALNVHIVVLLESQPASALREQVLSAFASLSEDEQQTLLVLARALRGNKPAD